MSEPWLNAPLKQPDFVLPNGQEYHSKATYTRPGLEVEVDVDAMEWPGGHPAWDLEDPGWDPDADATVWIRDHLARVEYYVVAREDSHGRARIVSVSYQREDDGDEHEPDDDLLDPASLWSWDRLALVAVGCARHSVTVRAPMTELELLHYVAAEVRRCKRSNESVTAQLALTLGNPSPRTITRLLRRAADAGLIPPRRRGRPSTSPRKDTPNA
jgi:hypothetical protein